MEENTMIKDKIIENFRNEQDNFSLSSEVIDKSRILSLIRVLDEANLKIDKDYRFKISILNTLYEELDRKMSEETRAEIMKTRNECWKCIARHEKQGKITHFKWLNSALNLSEKLSLLLRKEAHKQVNKIEKKTK